MQINAIVVSFTDILLDIFSPSLSLSLGLGGDVSFSNIFKEQGGGNGGYGGGGGGNTAANANYPSG